MKPVLKKKAFKTLQQKSFQCDIPETPPPTKPQGFQTPKSLSSSQGHYCKNPEANDVNKVQTEVKRVLTGRDGVRTSIRSKNPQNLRSSPQLGGLLQSDGLSPITNRIRPNLQNPEESIQILMNRLREIQNLHRTQVSTLRVIITSLKRRFYTNQNQSQKDTQTSRSTMNNQDMKDELIRLRAENQRLLAAQQRLIVELNQMAKARTLERQMLSMECSKLRIEVSSLKIKLLRMCEQSELECRPTPKLCHIFQYPQYDHSKQEMPQRISEIQSRFEISHARDKMECEYFTKCGGGTRANSTSAIKIHFSNSSAQLKAKKLEALKAELNSGSNQISLLEIDSKELSPIQSDNV